MAEIKSILTVSVADISNVFGSPKNNLSSVIGIDFPAGGSSEPGATPPPAEPPYSWHLVEGPSYYTYGNETFWNGDRYVENVGGVPSFMGSMLYTFDVTGNWYIDYRPTKFLLYFDCVPSGDSRGNSSINITDGLNNTILNVSDTVANLSGVPQTLTFFGSGTDYDINKVTIDVVIPQGGNCTITLYNMYYWSDTTPTNT